MAFVLTREDLDGSGDPHQGLDRIFWSVPRIVLDMGSGPGMTR
jgi:hypothetical protein